MTNILFFISLAILLLAIANPTLKKHYILIKSVTSILFCIIALVNFTTSKVNNWIILMLPILLCMVGDVSLGFYQMHKKSIYFKLGLSSFLVAHILFVLHMHTISSVTLFDLIIAIGGIGLTYMMDKMEIISFGKHKIACMAYSFFVTLLLVKGSVIALSLQTPLAYTYALASLLFFISDFILMFMYFRKSNTILHVFNLSTYYMAMYLFANILHR